MTKIKAYIKQHKSALLIAVILIATILVWNLASSFSETVTDSAWDGVVARDFTSGTGTIQNPYVISSAAEFAYMKGLLEGDDASFYADKNYVIANGFNYGEYDMSINNPVPFAGTIDGSGSMIYNATITNNLFNEIDGATIKNINFSDIEYTLDNYAGAILANSVSDTDIDMFIFSGTVNVSEDSVFGGFVYSSEDSDYTNVILNYDVTGENSTIYKFAYQLDGDTGSNILINQSDYQNTDSETDIVFSSFTDVNDILNLDDFGNDDFKVNVIDNVIVIEPIVVLEELPEEPESTNDDKEDDNNKNDDKDASINTKSGTRGIVASDTITENPSGISGTTAYINDFTSDYNYLKGLNFAEVRSTSLPSGNSTGYYDDEYLVKVQIIYDGEDINNSTLVGAVSPINNENTNKLVYYKYYPLERNSNGTLATNSDNDNYIRIELIDNPFSKRPYTGSGNNIVEYGFNGWVCNQEEDTTANLCSNSKFVFDNDDYTRYMEVAVNGGSQIIIHLNVTWYTATVISNSTTLTNFQNMTMVGTSYTTTVQENRPASYYWNQNYTQMEYYSTVAYNGSLPRYYWYKTSQNGTSYTYVSRNNSRCNYTNCYVYSANRTAIASGSKYVDNTSVTFVPNYNTNNAISEITITSYNTQYMTLQQDPDGIHTIQVAVQKNRSHIPTGGQADGFYYEVSNPTSAMISTGMYYNSSGTLCTSTSGCSPAYKLIQYDDDVLNSSGDTISIIEEDGNGNIVDATKYYYLVTRDMNILRYTNAAISYTYVNSSKPFTLTGTAVNGTSQSGRITIGNYQLNAGGDLVIENIRIDGPNYDLTVTGRYGYDNKTLGADTTSGAIYANSKNLKIGRNIISYDGTNYMIAQGIYGATQGSSPSGKFRVIVESGYYYAYHSGRMTSNSTNYTFNETTIYGSDYDRISNNNQKLRFLIGLDGYAGGNNTAGSSSLFASYNIIKSGSFGYNYNGSANSDNTAGLYIGARAGTYMNSLTGAKIEGGNINTVVGGYGYNGSTTTNSTFIGMSGGSVRSIYGGAGHSTTKGNRIICVTGGTVSYSILGGSDSYDSGDTNDGIVQGSTLVYVGGNVHVGGGTGELYGVESGSVFGAGGGDTTSEQKGTVYNSHVIINGGTIDTSVYGGGNHGSTGTQSTTSSTTVIDIYSGSIGSVFGGSKSADFSKSNFDTSSTIDINISGGTIGNVYGGSNTQGEIYGSVDIEITRGTITGNVYGGGQGSPTEVTNNVDITIGNSTGGPTIGGSVYGGSALGSVNSQGQGTVDLTVNNGAITGNIYGGGQGSSSDSATVYGDITVDISGGSVANVYGGADTSGVASGDVSVTITNGTVSTNVYGGGKGANTYVAGDVDVVIGTTGVANTPTIGGSVYGGSALGTVNRETSSGNATGDTTVTVNNGLITGSVYGGGEGSSTVTAYVVGSTSVSVSGGSMANVYGGADTSGVVSGDASVTITNGTVSTNVYGGGKGANTYVAGDVDVVIGTAGVANTPTIGGSVYGGSALGTVNRGSSSGNATGDTTVTVNNGSITGSVYGGGEGSSNASASVLGNVAVSVSGGSMANVYGGADTSGTVSGDASVTITNGAIATNVYGGGKGANTYVAGDVDVVIGTTGVANTPTIGGSVYGGSAFGTVNRGSSSGSATGDTTVTVNNGVITGSVFGGGQGNTTYTPYVLGDITVTINGGDMTNVFGGNDQAGSHTATNEVYLNGGIIQNVYGGGNRSSVTNTNVYLDGASVTNIYGGSNTLGTVSTTNVDILSGTVQNVYGGNNEGGTCGATDVNVTGTATINGAIYGGGNQVATTTTVVTLNSCTGTVPNVYGGGNSASVTTSNVTNNGVTVTNIFGGSNSSGTVTNSYVTQNTGTVTNIYGGNNAGGNTVTSHIDVNGGTITTIYGGGNQANGGTSNVNIDAGTVGTVFGGGNNAGLTTSNVTVNGGTVTDVYGGSNNTGTVTTTNVTVDTAGTISNIYGGGNQAQAGSTNVTFDSGTVTNIYGGGNLAQVTGNTVVDINGGTVNQHVFGGGNFGAVTGNATVTITDATILGNAYAAGNGTSAALSGNASITIDGATTIGTTTSVAPNAGCVFGGGNQAITGTQANNNSTTSVNIVGGTIYGNVYGGAKFSVIYGNTLVNIGQTAYTSNNLDKTDIYIKGNVFGGGEANSSGSEVYDWSFISVTQGTNITVDADTYTNFQIDGSFFGGGNASSATGDSYLTIRNYGSGMTPKRNVSIQRVTYVTIDNSSILLAGAIDRANDYDRELFSISRVDSFKLKNNSILFLVTGANLLKDFQSLDSSGNPAQVTIASDHTITQRTVDNRVYMYEGRNLNIAKDQQVTDYGEVTGMSFFGIFNFASGDVSTGIYNSQYAPLANLSGVGMFAKGSYVLGKHVTNHDITVNGFYSNYKNEETNINEVDYIDPTPKDAQFYMWYVGENLIEYNVNLVASKYSTLGSVEQAFVEFSKPNTSFEIESFDISDIATGVSLVAKSSIPRIAATASDANNIFGLSMEASNNGWLTSGKTNFYTSSPFKDGIMYYEGENSNVVPTMLFYLYHSKNITEEKDLGTVRITINAITKVSALSNEVEGLVVNVNMSTALFQTNEYEGAMTPGDKYELFTSTATNITTKSKFSVYYGLYASGQNIYQTGYHRALTSSYVLPENTKITMIDFGTGSTEYYYHVINASDVAAAEAEYQVDNECSYNLSLFTRMGSLNSNSNYDDALKNVAYYDGTASSEEFIFIVDFSDAEIDEDELDNQLFIEIRDANNASIIGVLGVQHDQLTYNLYYGRDSTIAETVTASANPLYNGHNDTFEVSINYSNASLSGVTITDTQYFDSKLGVQIAIKNANGRVVSGTDLTGAYFLIDGVRYYPDIAGYTHIKLADKVGNTKKWIIFNTENASIATGSYTFTFEAFASTDGIYYSSGASSFVNLPIPIINSKYGLEPILNPNSVIFSANNDKALAMTINYTSLLSNPNIRLAMYRRKYDTPYQTDYELVDLQDYATTVLTTSSNANEYVLTRSPVAVNTVTIELEDELITGTYRLSFRLYDNDTMIGDVNRYIVIK